VAILCVLWLAAWTARRWGPYRTAG
jgi:hypothetical protein